MSVGVSEHLHLDVTRILEVALDIDRGLGEVRLALAARRFEGTRHVCSRMHDLQALAPSACGRLDCDRPADLFCRRDDVRDGSRRLGRSRHDRDAGGLHRRPRRRLVPHQLDRVGWRPDPDEPRLLDGAGERSVFREEPVSRVHGLDAGAHRCLDQAIQVEIARRRRRRADQERLVSDPRVKRSTISFGVHGHRLDVELAQRPEDPDRNLASVGDQHAGERLHTAYSLREMSVADQLTVARAAAVVVVVVLFQSGLQHAEYWATAVFVAAMATDQVDGWLARRQGKSSALGSVLDPVADKILVIAMLIMVVGAGVFPAWMVALIVAREFLVSGASARGDRTRCRHSRTRPRKAEDVGAGDRGDGRWARRGRRVEQRRRLVDTPRRPRVHMGLGNRLRAGSTRTAAKQTCRLAESAD